MQSIIRDMQALGQEERETLFNCLEEVHVPASIGDEIADNVKGNRFFRGKACPHCKLDPISRNGKYNGTQRYICKSCGRTFTDFTRSPRHNSKKDISKWVIYARGMINGYSIRKCAALAGISIPTSFYWRHKILDAVRAYAGVGSVGGVIEDDETFFRESFKGNHRRSTNFTMPRRAHKRGLENSFASQRQNQQHANQERRKRGISQDQVCVLCVKYRAGNIVTELLCKGRMKHTDLEKLFENRIENDSILCTDSNKSYIKFARNIGVELQQVKRGKHKEGIYHIQHINSFQSKLKK